MLSPREAVRTLPSYHPPLAGRTGLRLDFNENTVGCSPRVLECLRKLNAEDLSRYPEREPVEATVAQFLGVSPAELLLTNGVDEAIHLLCETYLEPGDQALIVVPTYSMYRIYLMAAGAQVISVPTGKNFQFPFDQLRNHITDRTRLIAIANPNNPTGTLTPPELLLQLASSAPQAAVLIDEAYFEFCGQTLLPQRNESPNIFIARTFSKAYGLAGLRIGVLIGDPDQMRAIRRVSSPYNVNAVALACLPDAIADQPYIQRYVNEVLQSRACLENALQSHGVTFWPSQANFILARVGPTPAAAKAFVESMRGRGILVRDRSSDHNCEGCVRFTLGPREHTDRLLTALPQTIEELSLAHGVSQP
ncbi:MAG TPA: histidinol-phosphate transaminase [Candidatus Dormibacteraeota bacterium]|nr:histidinol-phosphate transaminase [Candidatus Dormibacteraeota bacterium]